MAQSKNKINRQNLLINIIICTVFFIIAIILFNIFYKSQSLTQLLIDIEIPQDDKYQVFYDVGNGFNEEDSESLIVKKNVAPQTLSFSLPPNVKNLRIDFGTKKNTIFVDKIIWKNSSKRIIWNSESVIKKFEIGNNIDELVLVNGKLKIVSNGKDPFLIINDTQNLSDYLNKDVLRIVFTYFLFLIIAIVIFFSLKLSGYNIVSNLNFFTSNYRSFVICLCFITIITVPMLSNYFGLTPGISDTEKRNLATKPDISFMDSSYKTFISDYENYVADNFGFRKRLIQLNNILKVKLLNTSPSDKVILGKDGWLFYNSEGEIDDYRGVNLFSDTELKKIKSNLEERSKWLKKKGIKFYITVAPNKSTIYSEFLPSNIKKYNQNSRLDQLVSYLSTNSEVHIIDMRTVLKEQKDKYIIYKKNDTHWNSMGAFIGYSEIAKVLKKDMVIPELLDLENFKIVTVQGGGDLGNMLSMNDILLDNYLTLVPQFETSVKSVKVDASSYPNPSQLVVNENTSHSDAPKLLMFRDSFTSEMIPFLSEHFSRSVYVWDQYFNANLIEKEKPDVVIFEVVERNIETLLIDNPENILQ